MIIEQNMKSYIDLGLFKIHLYGIIFALAFFLVYYVAKSRIKKQNLGLDDNNLMSLLGIMFISSIIFARLAYVFVYWGKEYLRYPLEIFQIWEGGLSYHGGMVGALIGLLIYVKLKANKNLTFLNYADLISYSLPLGVGLVKIGHFINGELWGRFTNGSWGVLFPKSDEHPIPRHPVQLYEALFEGLIVFIVLFMLNKSNKNKPITTGKTFALFLLFSGLMRFLTEFFREPDPQIGYIFTDFTLGQLLSIPIILSGIFLLQYINIKEKQG